MGDSDNCDDFRVRPGFICNVHSYDPATLESIDSDAVLTDITIRRCHTNAYGSSICNVHHFTHLVYHDAGA
ncbi:unnamed protein product [marine sediment metagenome]|uniref:Uncharacterized protein n=1 Tax=marine sediment metagenome TaxID=412755 RepID=X1SNR1_9ZZZZ